MHNVYDPANRFVNPSFEDGELSNPLYWLLSGEAQILETGPDDEPQPVSGRRFLYLLASRSPGPSGGSVFLTSVARQPRVKNLVPGRTYRIHFWSYLFDFFGTAPRLRIRIDDNDDGAADRLLTTFFATGQPVGEWVRLTTPSWTPMPFGAGYTGILFDTPTIGFAMLNYVQWLVDDVYIEEIVTVSPSVPGRDVRTTTSPPPQTFERAFLDELHGSIHKEGRLAFDLRSRLRRADDLDEPDRELLAELWGPPRHEQAEPDP